MRNTVKNMRILAVLVCTSMGISACNKKPDAHHTVSFTRIDSLTERFLEFQDSMLYTWNMMINDDNQKIRSMNNLVHELMVSSQFDRETLLGLQQRLGQLMKVSITPQSIEDLALIEEYDFATNTLVMELISLAESHEAYAHNKVLQKMVEDIKLTDQRVEENRITYDAIASEYNDFLETNKSAIKEIDRNTSLEKKPLFQVVSED